MFCTNCGYKLEENDRFCSKCGSSVVQMQPAAEVKESAQAGKPIIRRFKTEGLTFVNYNMPFRDENNNLVYQAKTVSESMFQYTFRAWFPDNRVAFTVKSKTRNMMTMFFELTDMNGQLITTIDQQVGGNLGYMYLMREAGLHAQGDFVNFNFGVFRNQQLMAEVKRDFTMIKDSYQAIIYDPSVEIPVLGLMMAIQLETASSRNRRRRHRW